MRDEEEYRDQLARELAVVLLGSKENKGKGLMVERGIIGLDEVWFAWNRARGVGK